MAQDQNEQPNQGIQPVSNPNREAAPLRAPEAPVIADSSQEILTPSNPSFVPPAQVARFMQPADQAKIPQDMEPAPQVDLTSKASVQAEVVKEEKNLGKVNVSEASDWKKITKLFSLKQILLRLQKQPSGV